MADIGDAGLRILTDDDARRDIGPAVIGAVFGTGKADRSMASPVMTFSCAGASFTMTGAMRRARPAKMRSKTVSSVASRAISALAREL